MKRCDDDIFSSRTPGVLLPLKFLLLAAASNDSSDVLEHFFHLGSRFLKRTSETYPAQETRQKTPITWTIIRNT